nr:MAG TPA: hypothetical protein [Caudoviricetes sp.]
MEGYKTWKYLVINFLPTEGWPRLFFVEASCRSEAESYIRKHCGQDYMLVDKYDEFVAKILDYPEIPHCKF